MQTRKTEPHSNLRKQAISRKTLSNVVKFPQNAVNFPKRGEISPKWGDFIVNARDVLDNDENAEFENLLGS